MYIYLITRFDGNDSDYDEVDAMVVAANSVPEARELASRNATKGDEATWLRSTETKVQYIGTANEIYDAPTVILVDVHNG